MEFIFQSDGVVDISWEVNMGGNEMKVETPAGCISDTASNLCAFICDPPNAQSCLQNYQLVYTGDTGRISGYDPVMGGASGGCSLGSSNGGTVTVTLS
jgi:hypothetical protein